LDLDSHEFGGDITRAEALEGGEVKAYAFSTSPDVLAIEIHLEDRVGNPVAVMTTGAQLPTRGSFHLLLCWIIMEMKGEL